MTIDQIDAKPFNIVRSFSVLSLCSIIVISTASAMLLSQFLRDNLLHRDAEVTKQFVQSIAQTRSVAAYFAENDYGKSKVALDDFFNRISHMPDVVRTNAYAPDRTIIWSNTPELVGKTFDDNPELDRALNGELVTESGQVHEERKPEHVMFSPGVNDFVEHYIPIHDPRTHAVVGVTEVYKVPRVLTRAIATGNRLVWTSTLIGAVFLYATLFWIVRRANRVIQQQRQALVESETMVAVGEMASSVAHSIRNPVAAIRSSAELAMEETEDNTKDNTKEYLGDIIREVDRFDGWIRELLRFSHEPSEAHHSTASVAEVIHASLHSFGQRLQEQGVEVSVDLPDALPAVRCDPQLLSQVLNSVISNALEAMPNGGRLQLTGKQVRIVVEVAVIDTGCGVPEDKLKDIFTPMVSHKPGGLGIGLALARQIVRRHGGDIQFASRHGVGTTVTLRLPIAD